MTRETPHEVELRLAHDRNEIGETLSNIQHRLSPEHLADQALQYISDKGGDMAMHLGRAIKANPVPLVLTGVGLAWLIGSTMTSRPRREDGGRADLYSAKAYGNSTYDYYEGYGEYESQSQREQDPIKGYGPSGEASQEPAADHASLLERAGAAATSLRQSSDETAEAFGERVAQAKAQVLDIQRQAGESIADFIQRVEETMTNLAASSKQRFVDASHRASEMARRAGHQAKEMRDRATDAVQDQPLMAIAIGIGVGALLGALLPISRREQEMLGPYGQEARERARNAARNLGDEAEHITAEAAEAAVQSLDDGVRQTVQPR